MLTSRLLRRNLISPRSPPSLSCLSLAASSWHMTLAKILLITIARVLINRIRRSRDTLYGTPDVNRTRVRRALYLLYCNKKQSEA